MKLFLQKLAHIFFLTGNTAIEKYLKKEKYGAVFAGWLVSILSCVFLIYFSEIFNFFSKFGFGNFWGAEAHVDTGREWAFALFGKIGIAVITLISILKAFRIYRGGGVKSQVQH